MNEEKIRENVENQLKEWQRLQNNIGREWEISPRATDFIIQLVDNIEKDPSLTWQRDDINFEALQELAISLIPNALNNVIQNGKYGFKRYKLMDGRITTWEIWHSLSRVIDRWCFVPKDV